MKSQTVTVRHAEGLHLRVAAEVAKIAQKSGAAVHIHCGACSPAETHSRADACSVLQLLTLGASAGSLLEIFADGHNEDAVLSELAGLFEQGSGI
jgi:phosphotransferase system HPr (HPr) family protein